MSNTLNELESSLRDALTSAVQAFGSDTMTLKPFNEAGILADLSVIYDYTGSMAESDVTAECGLGVVVVTANETAAQIKSRARVLLALLNATLKHWLDCNNQADTQRLEWSYYPRQVTNVRDPAAGGWSIEIATRIQLTYQERIDDILYGD